MEQPSLTQAPAAPGATAVLRVTYFTDPLCAWSWAFEPVWRQIRDEYGGLLTWRYRMGGMLASWENYDDPLNSVNRPAQMGAHWYEVSQTTGVPLDPRIWQEDPPASSYPASIAFKAAERQGAEAGETYLRRLREAVMLERRNIARWDVLLALAQEAADAGAFDAEQFRRDLDEPSVAEAFREDLKEASYRSIGRFPTLILQHVHGAGLIMVGYRPLEALHEALAWLAPSVKPERPTPPSAA